MSDNSIDICNVNVRSLNNSKIDAIKAELMLNFDLICLTETHLPYADVNDTSLPGFHHIMCKNREGRMGGGVALYAAEYIAISRIYDFEIPMLEAMWVQVKVGKNVFHLCVCYRPPNNDAEFWVKLQDSLDLALRGGAKTIILTGDLNADFHTRPGELLKLFSYSNNLTIHILEPTRITPTTATVLDQMLSNVPSLISQVEVLDPISNCDHCPVRLTLSFKQKFNKPHAFKRHVWDYKRANAEEFRSLLRGFDWDECFGDGDLNSVCGKWTTSFLNIARQCIPNRVVTVRPCDKTFYTPELRRLRRKKNRLHRKAKASNDADDWLKFRVTRNLYNGKIAEAKTRAESDKASKLKDAKTISTKKWWQLAKGFIKPDAALKSSYPPLKVGNVTLCDDKEKAESFNEFFLQSSNIDDSNMPEPDSEFHGEQRLSEIVITEKDVLDLVKCLDINKASGPDTVSHAMLKMAGDTIVPSLTKLFNLSFEQSIFPSMWKKANVVPIFKKEDNAVRDNYRPVSLLSCVAKLFERAVFKYVFNFLMISRSWARFSSSQKTTGLPLALDLLTASLTQSRMATSFA